MQQKRYIIPVTKLRTGLPPDALGGLDGADAQLSQVDAEQLNALLMRLRGPKWAHRLHPLLQGDLNLPLLVILCNKGWYHICLD